MTVHMCLFVPLPVHIDHFEKKYGKSPHARSTKIAIEDKSVCAKGTETIIFIHAHKLVTK